jgi:glyoxylase-like metal-dependent hydrolase (beta-lactamase superfamily II)
MTMIDRRYILKAGLGGLAALATAPLWAAETSKLLTQSLGGKITLITGAPGNVVALAASDGVVLVDSGSAMLASAVKASLGSAKVKTLFNTHYHADQSGGNELFANDGATIHAHVVTKQWLSSDYYLPAEIGRASCRERVSNEV